VPGVLGVGLRVVRLVHLVVPSPRG
jgi:hypothetical protein